ncbi:hypothetical protein AQUSIP_15090 [Aquicella siphonis]|uniref:YhdP central domain-containing protein n=1 Tax=Aquicella siphonis TaxID=254247 RepID=A0A5E4PIG5_9COXI|nr:YhdP family protein [Aquicella siphonis]VVC76203.1 hypothetical protein AQUSIP_15090 [Aquicella siphonis]
MKAWIKSLLKKTGYVIAGLIIIAAVFVCLVRFLTPILDEHRADFEALASKLMQTPVTIKNVRVSWYHYQPVIRLNKVTLLDKETQKPLLQVKRISILFSIPKSLWERKLETSGIMVTGAELTINESPDGELTVQEFSGLKFSQQDDNSKTGLKEAFAWLSQEPHMILRDIDLHFNGKNGQKRFVTLYDLNVENVDDLHQIQGRAVLHQDLPTEVNGAIEWTGKPAALDQANARAYVYVSGLSLPQWVKDYTWKDWQINDGIVSAKVWASWDQGTLQSIQSTFQSFGLGLFAKSDNSTHKINRLSGNVGWKRQGNGQVFAGNDILVDLPGHFWPATSFYVALAPDASGALIPSTAELGYVDLADVRSFLNSSPAILPEATKKMLSNLKMTGSLQNTAMTFSGPLNDMSHITLRSNFVGLGFAPWQDYPGMTNLTGSMQWDGSLGKLSLNSTRSVLQYQSLFANDIYIDQLSGEMQLTHAPDNLWSLNISSLQILNDDIAANVSGSLSLSSDMAPAADVRANFTMQKAANITRYLPMRVFDRDLNEWMRNAFLSGEVTSGQAVLRGKLSDFPFDNQQGEFSISGAVNNVDFRFAPDWPLLRHIKGMVRFIGRQIKIDVERAETLGIEVENVHGEIPYVGDEKPQVLQVKTGLIQTDFSQGLRYIHASPLEKKLGKMFADVELRGPIELKLGLSVPLKDPDKTAVQGDLAISRGIMDLVPWNLKLEGLSGQVRFTEDTTEAKGLSAILFNKPFQFDLTTRQKTKTISVIEASFVNKLDVSDLEKWLKLPFSKVVRGSAVVKGAVDLSLTEPLEIHLRSNLSGVSVNLVEPYGKKAQEERDFSADIIIQNDQPMRVKAGYGDKLNAAVILARKQDQFSLVGANLRFGSGAADWPQTAGIYITGQFKQLDWGRIKTYMNQYSGKPMSGVSLKAIDILADQLTLGGQTLTSLRLQASPSQNGWDVVLDSPEIKGQIKVPANFDRKGVISAQLQKVDLHAATGAGVSEMLMDLKTVPGISLAVNDLRYNDMPLGQVTFKAVPGAKGLNIQTLRIVSPRIDLHANGNWTQGDKRYVTHLQGGATSARVSELLSSFGMDVTNFISSNGSLNFDLTWNDAPYAPSLSSMNGRASLVLGPGRIVDVGQENSAKMDLGRMLSIFSLQTIPRRLALDFSDVFQKGYSFDSVRGDFNVQNGDIYTKNLRFEGPVARVGINGRIGLKNKDYNFILSVTAHVTSSIPVAATLLTGNPLIGLGALAVNTVIGSQVSSATTNYYSVTGPWNNPTWTSVKSSGSK